MRVYIIKIGDQDIAFRHKNTRLELLKLLNEAQNDIEVELSEGEILDDMKKATAATAAE